MMRRSWAQLRRNVRQPRYAASLRIVGEGREACPSAIPDELQVRVLTKRLASRRKGVGEINHPTTVSGILEL